jgi:hypothetical protein
LFATKNQAQLADMLQMIQAARACCTNLARQHSYSWFHISIELVAKSMPNLADRGILCHINNVALNIYAHGVRHEQLASAIHSKIGDTQSYPT